MNVSLLQSRGAYYICYLALRLARPRFVVVPIMGGRFQLPLYYPSVLGGWLGVGRMVGSPWLVSARREITMTVISSR